MSPLFDAYLVADWSAAAVPSQGKDSIWVAVHAREGGLLALENPATRAEAEAFVADRVRALRAKGARVLAGFDFPFGLPRGAASRLFEAPGWRATWQGLTREVTEGEGNANDRFEAADRMVWRGAPFWGHPQGRSYAALKPTKGAFEDLAEWRAVDAFLRGRGAQPKSVWQLSGAGAVGGQALTGIPALERLRTALGATVWPFETGFAAPGRTVVLAEVYPSLIPPHAGEAVKDAGQVRAVAAALAALDAEGRLAALFAGPEELDPAATRAAASEEGWILGAGHEAALRAAAVPRAAADERRGPGAGEARSRTAGAGGDGRARPAEMQGRLPPDGGEARPPTAGAGGDGYGRAASSGAQDRPPPGGAIPRGAPSRWIRDPAEIYRRSFEIVRGETRLERFEPSMAELAVRVVHACGDPAVADRLAWSAGAVEAGRAALAAGAPVICDAGMVAQGVIRRGLPAGVEVISAIEHPGCGRLAASQATTRSAAAMDLCADRLGGAVVAVGNAPTALFRLLELIDEGAPRPALILGFAVGFVGAAESKAALAADPRGVPFVALRGRKGGSAMAAAAVNALALGLGGDGLARPEAGR